MRVCGLHHSGLSPSVMLAEPQENTQLATGVQDARTVCFWKGYYSRL